jgi:hypothetical protein
VARFGTKVLENSVNDIQVQPLTNESLRALPTVPSRHVAITVEALGTVFASKATRPLGADAASSATTTLDTFTPTTAAESRIRRALGRTVAIYEVSCAAGSVQLTHLSGLAAGALNAVLHSKGTRLRRTVPNAARV